MLLDPVEDDNGFDHSVAAIHGWRSNMFRYFDQRGYISADDVEEEDEVRAGGGGSDEDMGVRW